MPRSRHRSAISRATLRGERSRRRFLQQNLGGERGELAAGNEVSGEAVRAQGRGEVEKPGRAGLEGERETDGVGLGIQCPSRRAAGVAGAVEGDGERLVARPTQGRGQVSEGEVLFVRRTHECESHG
ncbi:MAG: hypothetical protein HY905_10735 [Deltaproteobacteria bacterium]|nr:hypothetical protein [Deltaproteobacteria bacterium]